MLGLSLDVLLSVSRHSSHETRGVYFLFALASFLARSVLARTRSFLQFLCSPAVCVMVQGAALECQFAPLTYIAVL